jgi:hypothetical protein
MSHEFWPNRFQLRRKDQRPKIGSLPQCKDFQTHDACPALSLNIQPLRCQTCARKGRVVMRRHVHIGKDGIDLAVELAHRSLPFSKRMIHLRFAPRNPKLAKCQRLAQKPKFCCLKVMSALARTADIARRDWQVGRVVTPRRRQGTSSKRLRIRQLFSKVPIAEVAAVTLVLC